MIFNFQVLVSIFALALVTSSGAYAADYELDSEHTNINFDIDHLMISTVKGRFKDFSGKFILDDKTQKPTSVNATIVAKSLDTSEAKRDEHLRSKDFFEVEKFKDLTFASTEIKFDNGNKGIMKGNLTIHGITKPVTWAVEFRGTAKDPWGNEKAALKATTTINRKDFGLTWNKALELGGVLVGEDVRIEVNAEGNKTSASPKTASKK